MSSNNCSSILTLQKIQDKQVSFSNVSHGLRESEKINRFIEQSSSSVEAIFAQCDELAELLPRTVMERIDNPLLKLASK